VVDHINGNRLLHGTRREWKARPKVESRADQGRGQRDRFLYHCPRESAKSQIFRAVNISYHCALTEQSAESSLQAAYECYLVYEERESSTTCRFETGGTHDDSRDVDRTVQASGHATRMLEGI
jgi:hypothetical protein